MPYKQQASEPDASRVEQSRAERSEVCLFLLLLLLLR